MFFILSKVLSLLTSPLTWILTVLVYTVFTRRKNRAKKSLIIGVSMLVFFTNPLIANFFIRNWEVRPVTYASLPKHQYGVILSGVTVPDQLPDDRVHYQKGADRVFHTIDLYNRNIIKKIIVTGGSGSLIKGQLSEAENIAKTLIAANVPQKDIILERQARNTAENALYTRELLPGSEKVILITSAFHMRRALGCFEKVGIKVTPFSTDLYGKPYSATPDDWLVPKVKSLLVWNVLIKEYAGITVYRLRGYL